MNILEAQNLYKTFGPPEKPVAAVKGVSLAIQEGEILAFLGPNGAGKTTTIKMIAGSILPDAGTVLVNGFDPHRNLAAYRHMGAVLEGSRNLYFNLTARENLEYFGVNKGLSVRDAQKRTSELLESFGLKDKAKTRVQDLSRGMQQKVAVSVSLMASPKLLLLDEPTLGLDVEATEAIKVRLRELAANGHSILLTTHELNVAQAISHRTAIIRQGQIIVSDSTQALVKRFSGESYTVEVDGSLSGNQIEMLTKLGAVIDQEVITFYGEPAKIYEVLDVVRGHNLIRATRTEADLTEIYLKLTKEESPC